MEEIILNAQKREVVGKQVRALRRKGQLPAIIYGHGIEPQPISLDFREASRILPMISSSTLLRVNLDGKQRMTLIRNKQRHPVTGALLHVDFQEVLMTEKIRVTVGIELEGEASATKNFGGVLVTGQEELEVECLPGDLLDRVVVDVSTLQNIGDAIYVRDIQLPAQVHVLTDPDEMVVVVTPPISEAELEEVEAVGAEPEVIERGKKEEEEGEE